MNPLDQFSDSFEQRAILTIPCILNVRSRSLAFDEPPAKRQRMPSGSVVCVIRVGPELRAVIESYGSMSHYISGSCESHHLIAPGSYIEPTAALPFELIERVGEGFDVVYATRWRESYTLRGELIDSGWVKER